MATISLSLFACQGDPDRLSDDATENYEADADNLEAAADGESYDVAADNVEAAAFQAGPGYSGTSTSLTGLTYAGDPCTIDCSGHEAGYEWAEEQGISDPDDCGGKSDSFIEGCIAYAEGREPEGSSDVSYEE